MKKVALSPIVLVCICLALSGCSGVTHGGGNPGPPQQLSQVPRSAIKNLIVVILQNNSFDHLFGTYSGANGLDPSLPSYQQVDQAGKTITESLLGNLSPDDLNHTQKSYQAAYNSGKMDKYAWENGDESMSYYDNTSVGTNANGEQSGVNVLWNYAQQYALADNFFASAMASEPANMLYLVSANVGSGTDAFGYPQLDACTAGLFQQNQSNGATITAPLTFQNVGDQLSGASISWTWFHEDYAKEQSGECSDYVPQENAFQYFQSTANGSNIQNFKLDDFQGQLGSGSLPSVSFITAAPSHSMHPGGGTIANGTAWLDKVIQSVKNSDVWANTAIVVLWDESGGWYDHVPPPQLDGTIGLGARVPVMVISPFAKTNYISHQQMDFVSILRFIQWNWALGKFSDAGQSAREAQSGDICDMLTTTCGAP
ncbi:MAG TPA: alkaline phosphatase family protein [Terriglobales bacterium]|nr:alkaline phosphatase family protein [Terriglobales bacterium]